MSSEMSSRASRLRTAFSMAVWRSVVITERVRLRYLSTMSASVSTRLPVPRGWATTLSRVLPSLSVRRTRVVSLSSTGSWS